MRIGKAQPLLLFATSLGLASCTQSSDSVDEPAAADSSAPGARSFGDAELDALLNDPPMLTAQRLPPGYAMRRCLFVEDGETVIDGACAYYAEAERAGFVQVEGPRQIYKGIDYPDGAFPQGLSTDYVAQVEHEYLEDGSRGSGWQIFWNGQPDASHVQAWLGTVDFDGECYTNARTKLCIWET